MKCKCIGLYFVDIEYNFSKIFVIKNHSEKHFSSQIVDFYGSVSMSNVFAFEVFTILKGAAETYFIFFFC